MSQVPKLTYHAASYALLQQTPIVEPQHVAFLTQLEENCGVTLPASVKEWYSLQASFDILADFSNCSQIVQLENLGKEHYRETETTNCYFCESKRLTICAENQNTCQWHVLLNGSDDPPVIVTYEDGEDIIYNDKFSTYVYCTIWDFSYLLSDCYLQAIDINFPVEGFQFLRENFTELPTSYGGKADYTFRFQKEGKYIFIFANEPKNTLRGKMLITEWILWGNSETDVTALVNQLKIFPSLLECLEIIDLI